jgi:thiamine biosynthesis protein ThiS
VKPSIELNHRKYPWREGATVRTLMAENDFDYCYMIVKINKAVIEENAWESTAIAAGDKVEIIHVFGGG